MDLAEYTTNFEAAVNSLARGTFFGVTFVKRTDNTIRDMVCRTGVRVKNPKLTPQEAQERRERNLSKGLITVWDAQVREYRSIPVINVLRLKVRGLEILTQRMDEISNAL